MTTESKQGLSAAFVRMWSLKDSVFCEVRMETTWEPRMSMSLGSTWLCQGWCVRQTRGPAD